MTVLAKASRKVLLWGVNIMTIIYSNAEIKNAWSYASTSQSVFMA
jgi:hypothetical protein